MIALISLLLVTIVRAHSDQPQAQTNQGIYIGRQIIHNGTNINNWLGIPYAQQPIGNLRWMPSQALPSSNDTRFAYTPNTCPQDISSGVPMTEACLTLNVYAPENATNLPVYVWIHGGSFILGAGIHYDASSFVSTSIQHEVPIIFVTINYRIGLLGFLADRELYDEKSGIDNRSTTGNYGILDQIMALGWIKDNIRGFGGNPEQITVGGQSAGGISTIIMLSSSLVKQNTFQRAIIHSGSLWPNFISPLQIAIDNSGSILRTTTNCTTVQCLRNLTTDQILSVQRTLASKSIFEVAAPPVIDNYVLNDTMENNYAKGNFQKIPILIGSTANETTPFTCPLFNDSATVHQVQDFFTTIYINTSIINQIPDIYGPISSSHNPLTYLNIVFSDSWAHCGSRRIATKLADYNVPAYLYTYNHIVPVAPTCRGAAHVVDLLMFFPTILPYVYPNYNFTAAEQQLSTNMMLYWINFIRTSNPNFEGSLAHWDAYTHAFDNDFAIDIHPQMRNSYYNSVCTNLWDLFAISFQ